MSNHDLTLTTAALAVLLTFKNWQRPGAAAHLKVAEVNEATKVDVQGQQLLVIKVKEHKTGMHGSAKLTLAKSDAKRLKRYQHYVRPLLDPSGTKPEFLLPGGKPVTQMTHLLHKLEEFGVQVPTATRVRKIRATVSARSLTSASDIALIGTQMSHSLTTQDQHYRATKGAIHAAEGFVIMEAQDTSPGTTKCS